MNAKNAGNYINRALARFHQNNLRGAMSDYDLALDIDPNNFIGHYNRGLLRAQVGDDNRAIEDFDFVLQIEPDNMMATLIADCFVPRQVTTGAPSRIIQK